MRLVDKILDYHIENLTSCVVKYYSVYIWFDIINFMYSFIQSLNVCTCE